MAMKADRRLYVTADGRLVEEGDADARYLLACKGDDISEAQAAEYRLQEKDGKVRQGGDDELTQEVVLRSQQHIKEYSSDYQQARRGELGDPAQEAVGADTWQDPDARHGKRGKELKGVEEAATDVEKDKQLLAKGGKSAAEKAEKDKAAAEAKANAEKSAGAEAEGGAKSGKRG